MNSNNRRGNSAGGLVTLGTSVTGSGCLTVILLIGAIFLGRRLDMWLGTEPWILLALVFTSIPLSLYMMVHSALSAARTAQEQYEARQRERDTEEFAERDR